MRKLFDELTQLSEQNVSKPTMVKSLEDGSYLPEEHSEMDIPSEMDQPSEVEHDYGQRVELHINAHGQEKVIRVNRHPAETERCVPCEDTTTQQSCTHPTATAGERCAQCEDTTQQSFTGVTDCIDEVGVSPYEYDTVQADDHIVRETHRINSFDQVAHDIAQDLQVFDQVEDRDLRDLAVLIPERNHDRLLSGTDDDADTSQAVSEIPEEEPLDVDHDPEIYEESSRGYGHHEHHEHQEETVASDGYEQGQTLVGESKQTTDVNEDIHHGHHHHHEHHHVHHHEEQEEVLDEQFEEHVHDDEHHHMEHNHETASRGLHHSAEDDESDIEMPGAPPSFIFRTERLSRNVADAMSNIWDRFWAEDVKQILQIIKNRFSQLMPYFRRFLAHLVAFWGGITYIKRALSAFIRILNKDKRVRELLERVGWASATTIRVFLSICAMLMQATLQMYYLVRNKIIPDIRRVIPIIYYKTIMKVLRAAQYAPWSLMLGPFSLTFDIDESKVPDRFYLHDKLSVAQNDVTFENGGVHSFMRSMRETLHMARQHRSSESSPVHTQSTDETPLPPPTSYSVSGNETHKRSATKTKGLTDPAKLARTTPLTERTNDGSWRNDG